MDTNFWIERWEQNQIGFHQSNYNNYLQQYWDQLQAEPNSCVFVPLCGKSRDLLWLHSQGYKILGNEISPLAVGDFFKESDLKAKISPQGKFTQWLSDGITLLQGDFFDLSAEDLQGCSSVFDRAALIALPPQMRIDYVRHLSNILPASTKILLITLEYNQNLMQGPPFSVPQDEVQQHYKEWFEITVLQREDIIENAPPFKKKGLNSLIETVYLLSPK